MSRLRRVYASAWMVPFRGVWRPLEVLVVVRYMKHTLRNTTRQFD